jgi:hypothetical protein
LLSTGLVYRPLEGEPELVELALAWRRDEPSEVVSAFLGVVRDAIDPASGNIVALADALAAPILLPHTQG